MKVIICGAGQVGQGIARRLAAERNDVTVIDISGQLVRQTTETIDVRGIVGHGAHPDVLQRAGAQDADLLIAVTYADEVNMVACAVANALFKVPLKIARVRAQSYLDPAWQDLYSDRNMPIDVIISPELEVARSILRRLEYSGAFETLSFADGAVQVVGTRILEGCPLANTPLRQLTELFPEVPAVILAIIREGKLFVPATEDFMQPDDLVYFSAPREQVPRMMDLLGHQGGGVRRMVIVGGGNVGLFVAREIEAAIAGVKVRIVEHDKARAEAVADQLTRTVVLHGDGLDEAILNEAGIEECEAVLAVTNDDEVNILASLIAKRLGARRALTLVNNPNYSPLTQSLGIDVAIDPRATTVSTILQHIRRGRIKALSSIEGGKAEIIEAEALDTSPLVDKPLREAGVPDGVILGAIIRKGQVMRPEGDLEIEAGDRVILLARADMIRKVEQLFRVSLEFF